MLYFLQTDTILRVKVEERVRERKKDQFKVTVSVSEVVNMNEKRSHQDIFKP